MSGLRSCLDISDRVAVVVGATSGSGRTIALGLAAHGAVVVPTGRRAAEANAVCDEIEAAGGRTLRATADVTKRESLECLRDAAVSTFGQVNILVNAAGYTTREPTAGMDESRWTRLIDTNLNGVLRACQVFYEPLKASRRGRIINIASLGSFVAFHEVAAYCAAKTAILSLTRSLACEWAGDGIAVNAIAPGVFPTELNSGLIMGTSRGKEMLMRTPMGRFGKPEELVGPAILLASDGANFITGHCIVVDGGYLASGVNS
jgi:NAD(P)-dependent dehydrogenase (short-subunit alcohol dehydrogenase family)